MEARLAKLADAKKRLASYKKQTLQRNSAKKLPEDQVNLEQISDPKLSM